MPYAASTASRPAILVLRDACDLDVARTVAAIRAAARAMVRGFLLELEQPAQS